MNAPRRCSSYPQARHFALQSPYSSQQSPSLYAGQNVRLAVCTAGLIAAIGAMSCATPPSSFADESEEQAISSVQEVMATPTAESFDATGRVLIGKATPGYAVMAFDPDWNFLGYCEVLEDGSYSLTLSGSADLSTISVYLCDSDGTSVAEPLNGPELVAQIAARELASVEVAAGQSTLHIVSNVEGSLDSFAAESSIEEVPANTLPLLPYVLGVASAVVGVGIATGCYAAYKRRAGKNETPESAIEQHQSAYEPVEDNQEYSTGLFTALIQGATASSETMSTSVEDSHPPMPEFDELEAAALAYVGLSSGNVVCAKHAKSGGVDSDDDHDPDGGPGGSHSDTSGDTGASVLDVMSMKTDLTVPFKGVEAQQSPEDFATLAQVLASGTGKVHHITVPSSHLDFSGMDVVVDSVIQHHNGPAADPMVGYDDWQEVAIRELEKPIEVEISRPLSTEEYVDLLATKPRESLGNKLKSFFAPVIGPGIDHTAAAQRQELVRSSSSKAAALLRQRDEEFLMERERRAYVAEVTRDGVPIIGRGAPQVGVGSQPYPVLPAGEVSGWSTDIDRVSTERERGGCQPSYILESAWEHSVGDGCAAATAASTAYAAFDGYSALTITSQSNTVPAYAVNDTGTKVQTPLASSRSYRVPEIEDDVSSDSYEVFEGRTSGLDEAAELSGYSNAYVDYMVQDEFAHRHDTTAQRNAALGRMHVVNGQVISPIPVREPLRRHRA